MVEQYSVHVCIRYATLNLHCLVWSMLPYTAPTALALAGQPHSCQRHFWGNAADLATSACCTQTRASAGLRGMLHCALQVSCSSGITGHMSMLPGRARPWELFLAQPSKVWPQWQQVHRSFCRSQLLYRRGRTIMHGRRRNEQGVDIHRGCC